MADLMIGKTAGGLKIPVLVDTTGQLMVSGGGGGGGSTDMTVANAQLTAINANTDGLEGKADTSNGILTTTAADIATIKNEAVAIDGKLPALSSGRVPVEANNPATQVYNYTATGAVAVNAVLIGPIECSQFREVSIQITSAATGQAILQISNDSSSWRGVAYLSDTGQVQATGIGSVGIYNYQLLNSRFFRVIQSTAQTSGTTTLVAYASQQATPKMYQSVTVAAQVGVTPQPSVSNGFTTYHTLVSTASTNATSVKTSAGQIGTLILTNTSATWAYFKLVNKASAPTTGTDTAIINIGVAPNTTQDCSTAFAGLRMTTGIAYYISNGVSLTDNTALATAGTFLVNMTYV